MMGLLQAGKSVASAIAEFFVPPLFWQRSINTEQRVRLTVQARKGKVIGLHMNVPQIESEYTAFLTFDEACKLSNLLAEVVMQIEQPNAKQETSA